MYSSPLSAASVLVPRRPTAALFYFALPWLEPCSGRWLRSLDPGLIARRDGTASHLSGCRTPVGLPIGPGADSISRVEVEWLWHFPPGFTFVEHCSLPRIVLYVASPAPAGARHSWPRTRVKQSFGCKTSTVMQVQWH